MTCSHVPLPCILGNLLSSLFHTTVSSSPHIIHSLTLSRTCMFFFIVSVLPSASSSLFCLWNHFHTLTAQALESSPGALCVCFVTTADSPSSRSTVSPSSMGTVLWEDFTCPGLGECPHWARVQVHWWVVSLPQSALTLISPHGKTSRSRIQSDWCHSNHIHGACHSLRQKCNIPENPYNKNGVRKLQNMTHGKHWPDVKAPSSPMHTDSIVTWVWGSSKPLWLSVQIRLPY